jgi:hypothetical protein
MKKKELLIGIASVIALGIIIYAVKKDKSEKRAESIADAGYETAHDILYPMRSKWFKRHRLS